MSYGSYRFTTPLTVIARLWDDWKAARDRAVTHYYNQRIEQRPEAEAYQYWTRLKHPQSGVDPSDVSDAMLSRLMDSLIQQGISKFAVDCFILELRRLRRSIL